MHAAKKAFHITFKLLVRLLVIFTIVVMIFTAFTVATVDKNERSIFGLRFYVVRTDSMSLSENNADLDVHFNAGDIVIVKNIDEDAKRSLKEGDVITFLSVNSVSYGETVTHMIREVKRNNEDKLIGYVTYGTNTGMNDETLVEPSFVMGVYRGKLVGVGKMFAFLKSVPGYIVCILTPFLLLIIYNGINVVRLLRRYKQEKAQELVAEKEKLEAQRAENQRMMQELLALKEQLEKKSGEGTVPTDSASEANSTQESAYKT